MLLKVFTFLPSQVRSIRILLESQNTPLGDHIFEADIEFIYRFMIDKKIKYALERTPSGFLPIDEDLPSNLKYVFLDLEVFTNRKPDPRKLRVGEKVICATLWDNYSKKYHLFYEYSRQLTLPSFGPDVIVHYCVTERELLKSVARYLIEQDPDVIAGYNIDWDLTCLIKTMEQRYKMSPDVISPLKKVKIRNSKKRLGDILINAPRAKIWGRSTLDLLELYMKMHLSGLEEMTLEYVAQLEKLPVQKILVPDFFETWNKNPELIIRRNLSDVQIYVELEKKLNLIRFADEQRKLVGCKLEDTLSSKKMLDLFMMRMKGKKIMPTGRSRGAKYIGAYVRDPLPGMYSWVIQLDFSALYPNIMLCFNIDPDTFRNPQNFKGSEDLFRLDESHAFVKDPIGLIPKMLKTLLELRATKKKLQVEALAKNDDESYKMYNLQEGVIKVLSNALYGVMGYRFRQGSKETVESVTLMGRNLITFVADKVTESGRKVIYGDTDSVFIEAKGQSLDECLAEAKELQAMVHAKLPEFLAKFGKIGEQPFNADPAQIYSAFFILEAKKRYAGKIEWDSKRGTKLNYKYNIKGLETRRSDLSILGKRIQKEVIHKLLEKISKEEMLKFLETELNPFDTLPLTEIGTPSAIGQPLKAYKGNAIQKTSAEYCYDEQTEILTSKGWKFLKDLKINEWIVTLNKNESIEYQQPEELQVFNHNGSMYKIQNQNIDLLTTLEHNMFVRTEYQKEFSSKSANEIIHRKFYFKKNAKWEGIRKENIQILDSEYQTDAFLSLLGFYISEGSSENGQRGHYRWKIAQKKNTQTWKEIKDLFERMNLKYNYWGNEFYGYDKNLWEYFRSLGKSHEKRVPREILDLDSNHLRYLWDSLLKGDGTITNSGSEVYSSVSKELMNNIQELLLKIGSAGNIGKCKSGCYWITKLRKLEPAINYKKIQDRIIEYRGKVYCIQVPNHVIYVRRNGKAIWSCNSNNFLNTQFDVGSKPKRIAIKGVPPRTEQSEIIAGLVKDKVYKVKNLPLSEITKLEIGNIDIKNKLKSFRPNGSFVLDMDASNQNISISYLQGYSDTHSIAIDHGMTPPTGFIIDYLKMLDATVKKKIEKLIAIIGITWEEINLKPELKIVPKVPKKRKEKIDTKRKRKVKDDKQKDLTQFKC